jgi:tRNA pseudouridine13 synthase
MRYKVQPEDFTVEEQIALPLAPGGRFAVYRVRKRGVTTLRVRARMARVLRVPHSAVVFPALKDKDAVAVQYVAVRSTGPARLTGDGFEAEFVGRSPRALTPADIAANRFAIALRDLSAGEAARIPERLAQVARFGLPNYFDQQRFGSLAPGEEHIGKRILQRDAEGALRAYLTHRFVGDPAPVRKFKAFAHDRWGDWDVLFEAAPRPSNFRSVLTYLRDHPTKYRKTLNLITRRLLSLYLAAYQSLLWNRIAARYLAARLGEAAGYVEIAGEQLPLYHEFPPHLERDLTIPLPSHRAVYAGPDLSVEASAEAQPAGRSRQSLETIAARVLAEEGLTLHDLKARILKKAYLPKGKRALLLLPRDTSASPPQPDDLFPGQQNMTLAFTLPRGSYATLVLKALST